MNRKKTKLFQLLSLAMGLLLTACSNESEEMKKSSNETSNSIIHIYEIDGKEYEKKYEILEGIDSLKLIKPLPNSIENKVQKLLSTSDSSFLHFEGQKEGVFKVRIYQNIQEFNKTDKNHSPKSISSNTIASKSTSQPWIKLYTNSKADFKKLKKGEAGKLVSESDPYSDPMGFMRYGNKVNNLFSEMVDGKWLNKRIRHIEINSRGQDIVHYIWLYELPNFDYGKYKRILVTAKQPTSTDDSMERDRHIYLEDFGFANKTTSFYWYHQPRITR